jgi:hypothetical protein
LQNAHLLGILAGHAACVAMFTDRKLNPQNFKLFAEDTVLADVIDCHLQIHRFARISGKISNV